MGERRCSIILHPIDEGHEVDEAGGIRFSGLWNVHFPFWMIFFAN
jgi:hypothetical protein